MQPTFHRSAACLFTLLYVIIVCAGCAAAVVGGGGVVVWGGGGSSLVLSVRAKHMIGHVRSLDSRGGKSRRIVLLPRLRLFSFVKFFYIYFLLNLNGR